MLTDISMILLRNISIAFVLGLMGFYYIRKSYFTYKYSRAWRLFWSSKIPWTILLLFTVVSSLETHSIVYESGLKWSHVVSFTVK